MTPKHSPSGSLDDGNAPSREENELWLAVREWLYRQYEKRGDLLETKAIAETHNRPFYLQADLERTDWIVRAGEQLLAQEGTQA